MLLRLVFMHVSESLFLFLTQLALNPEYIINISIYIYIRPNMIDTSHRDWENDSDIKKAGKCNPNITHDIARQLIESDVGKKLHVILGGGRREFRDVSMSDEENLPGSRTDGRDLIVEWLNMHKKAGRNATYVWNKSGLNAIDNDKTDQLLGLFHNDHCLYDHEITAQKKTEHIPRLSEMTEAAIKHLSKQPNGFFLFVEGARIDMAHHDAYAYAALDETKEFSNAVRRAIEVTNPDETLIVVTADHGHTMTYNGYSVCGQL